MHPFSLLFSFAFAFAFPSLPQEGVETIMEEAEGEREGSRKSRLTANRTEGLEALFCLKSLPLPSSPSPSPSPSPPPSASPPPSSFPPPPPSSSSFSSSRSFWFYLQGGFLSWFSERVHQSLIHVLLSLALVHSCHYFLETKT